MRFAALLGNLLWSLFTVFSLLSPLGSVAAILVAAQAAPQTVSQPAINYGAIGGGITVLGDFDGLSFYDSVNALSFLAPSLANALALYTRNETSGSVVKIASVEGSVSLLQRLGADTVLVFGSFSSINDQQVVPPVILNVSLQAVTPILTQQSLHKRSQAVSGLVLTTFVDKDLIYLGGDFEYNSTFGAAVYNVTSGSLASLPFEGFGQDSSVNAILKYPPDSDDGSIIFGGSFNTLGLPELLKHNVTFTHNVTNTTNSTNTSFISAEQVISLKHATFSNVNGLSSNVDSSVICPRTSPVWALDDAVGGQWSVLLPLEVRGITPTKVRIYVPSNSLDGIRDFRIYTFPNNGIMNLTYVDPTTNTIAFCDASCPLQLGSTLRLSVDQNIEEADLYADDDTVYVEKDGSFSVYPDSKTKARNLGYGSNYQEFALVNDVMIDALTLTTTAWYGSRGEFSGFELYLDSITVYGNETLNESNCGSESSQASNSAVINSGTWNSVQSLSNSVTNTDYLVSVVDGTSSITLYPNISYAGNYSILFYTPGCSADNSCAVRSRVNVTLSDINDKVLSSTIISQNNLENKYDPIFYGHLNGSSSSGGRNKVEIAFDSAIDSSVSSPWVVVDKVIANIVSLDDSFMTNSTNSTNSTVSTTHMITSMSLNGLFEYSLANFTDFSKNLVYEEINNTEVIKQTNTFVGNSTINVFSGNLSDASSINNMIYSPDSKVIYLNGEIMSPNVSLLNSNLVSLAVAGYNSSANNTEISSIAKRMVKRDDQTILGATFNDTINSIQHVDGGLLVLGAFSLSDSNGIKNLTDNNSTTTTANNFALYSGGEWYSFGNSYIPTDFSQFTLIVLNGTEYYVFSSSSGEYIQWDNTNKRWSSSKDKLDITAAIALDNNQQVVGGSSFGVLDYYGVDQGSFQNTNSFSSLNTEVTSGSILTSYYLNSSFSVLGGEFQANDTIENIALIQNSEGVSLGGVNWPNGTAVTNLYVNTNQEYLFAGTNGPAEVRGTNVTGLLVYSLKNQTFSAVQPPDLSTSDGSPLEVNALALYDQNSQLLVGGNFNFAGSLGCGSVCLYDIVNTRWLSPYSSSLSASLGGVVTGARFFNSDAILLSGNLTLNSTQLTFVVYEFSSSTFSSAGTQINNVGVSGTVSKFIVNDNSDGKLDNRMAAIGSNFVIGFNGNAWARIDSGIDISESTQFTDLKIVQLSLQNSNNPNQTYFDNNKALILSGTFNLTSYGTVNTAMFDGKTWIPLLFSLKDSTFGQINSLLFQDLYKSQSSSDLATNEKHLNTGQVVGISLACAIGSTALLGLLYIIPVFFLMKGSKKKERVDQRIHEDEMMDIVNPEDLIHEMDAQRNY